MPYGQRTGNVKQKQYGNKINKDLKINNNNNKTEAGPWDSKEDYVRSMNGVDRKEEVYQLPRGGGAKERSLIADLAFLIRVLSDFSLHLVSSFSWNNLF